MPLSPPPADAELAFLRRAFARQVCAKAGVADARIEAAFARTPREAFLGRGPWRLVTGLREFRELEPDPVLAYQDALFALAPGKGINNGEPSLHARLLGALALPEGARVAHLGAGTGYYTAILAELVGPSGRVLAIEHDEALAGFAARALASRPQVEVVRGDALVADLDGLDAAYVSFAVEDYPPAWIEAVAAGMRLLAPLGARPVFEGRPAPFAHGAAFLLAREGADIAARWVTPAHFVCAQEAGAVTPEHRDRLARAFAGGRAREVSRFVVGRPAGEDAFFAADGWALT